jgi:hypothetical protein
MDETTLNRVAMTFYISNLTVNDHLEHDNEGAEGVDRLSLGEEFE